MGKIVVEGFRLSNDNQSVHISVKETQIVSGQDVEVPIGEAFITFPPDAQIRDMLPTIRERAREIEQRAEQAKERRAELQRELEAP